MKIMKGTRVLLAALVVLLGIHSTAAANVGICTITALTNTDSCDCPGGTTGTTDGTKHTVVDGTYFGVITKGATASVVDVRRCVDIHPGFEVKTAVSGVSITGVEALTAGITAIESSSFVLAATAAGKVTYDSTSGAITALAAAVALACPAGIGSSSAAKTHVSYATGCNDLLPGYTFIPSASLKKKPSELIRACVAGEYFCAGATDIFKNAAIGGGVSFSSANDATVTGPDLIGDDTITMSVAATGAKVAAVCPTGSSTTVTSYAAAKTNCVVSSGYYINARSVSVPAICRPGGVCAGGGAVGTAGGIAGICTEEILQGTDSCDCPGGTHPGDAGVGTSAAGDYTVGITAGNIYGTITLVSGKTPGAPITLCTDVMPGYEVKTAVSGSSIVPALTLTAGITAVDDNAFAAKSANKVTISAGKITTLGQTLSTPCPVGIGNTISGSSASGVNAASYATACVDVLPTYTLKATITSSTVADILLSCTAGSYCPGIAGLFTASGKVSTSTGVSTQTDRSVNALTTLTAAVVLTTGTYIGETSCPVGSTNTAAGTTIASCLVQGGYYIDISDVNAPVACTKGHYCPGGGAVGTAGGDTYCPYGSDTVASAQSSLISDCALVDGFYIATGALNTPVPCLTDFICVGGGSVGTAGGSVACPTGSKNAACAGGSSSTTVNLTPSTTVTAAAAPAVTVTNTVPSPDVTVSNTVPSASSGSTTVASLVLVAISAFVVAF